MMNAWHKWRYQVCINCAYALIAKGDYKSATRSLLKAKIHHNKLALILRDKYWWLL